jgi:hypothetical protein
MSQQFLYTATRVVCIRDAVFRNATLEIDPASDVDTRAALAADAFDAVVRSKDCSAEKLQIKTNCSYFKIKRKTRTKTQIQTKVKSLHEQKIPHSKLSNHKMFTSLH